MNAMHMVKSKLYSLYENGNVDLIFLHCDRNWWWEYYFNHSKGLGRILVSGALAMRVD